MSNNSSLAQLAPALVNLGGNKDQKKLISKVLASLRVAAGLGAAVVALDAISAGVGEFNDDCPYLPCQ